MRSNAWRLVTLVLLLVPFLIGDVVRAFGWYILLGRHGALSWFLGLFGVDDVRVLGTLWAIWLGMIQVGLPIAVSDAVPQVKKAARWITSRKGGDAAVREVCDAILASR